MSFLRGKSSAVQRCFLSLSLLLVYQVSVQGFSVFLISLLYLQEVARGQFNLVTTKESSHLTEEPRRPIPMRRDSKNNTHRNLPFPFPVVYRAVSALLVGGRPAAAAIAGVS